MIIINLTGRMGNQLLLISKALSARVGEEEIFCNIHEYDRDSSTADGKKIRLDMIEILTEDSLSKVRFFSSKLFYRISKSLSRAFLYFRRLKGCDDFYSQDFLINIFGVKIIGGYHQKNDSYLTLRKLKTHNYDWPSSLPLDSIAIHVRLGDYMTAEHIEHHIDAERGIINYIENQPVEFRNHHFVVFSDGCPNRLLAALREMNIVFTIASEYGLSDVDEFLLLSQFKTVIASNSSYSCCAAFAGLNKARLIVPAMWLRNYPTPHSMFSDQVEFYEV